MKKLGITLLILSLFLAVYLFILPVENGKFIGNWYAIGDSEATNTLWEINHRNIIDPDVYWADESFDEYLYKISKDDSIFSIKDPENPSHQPKFEGILKSVSKDTVLLQGISRSGNTFNDLLLIRLADRTYINDQATLDKAFLLNDYWTFKYDSIEAEIYFSDKYLYEDFESAKIAKVLIDYSNWDFREAYNPWVLKEFNGQYILTLYLRGFFSDLNFMFHTVEQDSITATLFLDTFKYETVLYRIDSNEEERIDIQNTLISKTWMTKSVEQLPQTGSTSTIAPYYNSFPNYDLSLDEIKDNSLSFKFNQDSTFQIFKSDSLLLESNWWLSNNSKLIFSDGRFNEFINIIDYSEDQIVLEMHNMVWGNDDMIIDKYPNREKNELETMDSFHQLKFQYILK